MRVKATYGQRDRILIVGGGPAGWSAAARVRRLGFPGQVNVLCDETTAPYDRTACSKGLLNGHQKPKDIRLDTRDCPDVIWGLGRRAMALDPYRRTVTVEDGETIEYDGLVIATGGRTVLPDGWPTGEPGLRSLHGLDDAWAVRGELRDARTVAIVGGGLTGCEVACAVRGLARKALIINSQPYLMPRALGEPVGRLVTAEYRLAGIDMRLGRRVVAVARSRMGWRLTLDDGDEVYADLVVVTIGERAEVDWLAGTGLDTSNGVLCDPTLRVVGADGIVAAGSVARWPNARYGERPYRIGQWISALEQGQAAMSTLLAGGAAQPVSLLPRFWSEQLGLRIQVCGRIDANCDVAITKLRPGRQDTARAGVIASYHDEGRLCGVVAVNATAGFTVATRTLLADAAHRPRAAALPSGEPRIRAVW